MTPRDVGALATTILETHHVFLHREMPAVTQALVGAPAELRRTWAELEQLLEEHLMKEEVILFPSIQALAAGDPAVAAHVLGPVPQMKADHATIRLLEARLRALAHQAGEAAPMLLAVLGDLEVHTRREDEELFPGALALLPGTPDLEAIDAAAAALSPGPPHLAPHRADPPTSPPRRRRRLLDWLLGRDGFGGGARNG